MFRSTDGITDTDLEVAAQFIEVEEPDYVGISTRSFAMNHAENLANRLCIPVIAGGWGPTLEPQRAYKWADWVCFGEGDKTIMDIARGKLPITIPNLHNKFYALKDVYPALTTEDLEKLPVPTGDLGYQIVDGKLSKIETLNYPYILVSRGCPMNCSYCMGGQHRRMYKKYTDSIFPKHRVSSVDSVIQEIKRFPKSYSSVKFSDEIFPWKKEWIDEFCERYPVEIGKPFFAHIRPEFHSEDKIKRLIDAGLTESAVGLQSASPKTLELYQRKLKPSQALKLAEAFTNFGVSFPYEILLNNPYETEADMKMTLDWLWSAPYQNTTVMFLVPFPNSPFYNKIQEDNPPETDKALQIWYGWLTSIAAMGKWQRIASKVIYWLGLFKKHPGILIRAYTGLFKWRHGNA